MTLSIIILNYNTKDLTIKCISSVIKLYHKEIKNKELEIIVVDNASSDGSVQSLGKLKHINLIKNNDNYGFSKGNNIGARKAKGNYILFLNSDTQVQDSGFLKMVDFMENNPKVGILGGKLLNTDGSVQKSAGNFYNILNLLFMLFVVERIGMIRKAPNKPEKVDWVSGASFMIRIDLFKKLSGFDEHFFMYEEDMELCYRAKKLGFDTYFYPDLNLIHKELGSSNREFAVKQIYKGLLYFYKLHKPYWQYLIAKILLFAKAFVAYMIGILSNNNYLKKTYSQALKLSIV